MTGEAETVGCGSEDVFEARRGIAVGVERAREPEHEADGDGIRIVAARGYRLVGQGTLGSGRRATLSLEVVLVTVHVFPDHDFG